jgi:hypothetical protein
MAAHGVILFRGVLRRLVRRTATTSSTASRPDAAIVKSGIDGIRQRASRFGLAGGKGVRLSAAARRGYDG